MFIIQRNFAEKIYCLKIHPENNEMKLLEHIIIHCNKTNDLIRHKEGGDKGQCRYRFQPFFVSPFWHLPPSTNNQVSRLLGKTHRRARPSWLHLSIVLQLPTFKFMPLNGNFPRKRVLNGVNWFGNNLHI